MEHFSIFQSPQSEKPKQEDSKIRKIALAIHPWKTYGQGTEKYPGKEFIQKMFENPVFDTTVAVKNEPHPDGSPNTDPNFELFVTPKETIESPALKPEAADAGRVFLEQFSDPFDALTPENRARSNKIVASIQKNFIIKPEDFVAMFQSAKEVQVTMMGGEVPDYDLEYWTGCHRTAFQEMIKYFYDPASGHHETLRVYIPFPGVFDAAGKTVNFENENWREIFKEIYSKDARAVDPAATVTVGRKGAIISFKKKNAHVQDSV